MANVREGRRRCGPRRVTARVTVAGAVVAIAILALAASSRSVTASQDMRSRPGGNGTDRIPELAVGAATDPLQESSVIETPELVYTLTLILAASSDQLLLDDFVFELLDGFDSSADTDLDGIADEADCDPQSDLRPTIVLGERDTGVPNTLLTSGCTIADLIVSVTRVAKNHGQFVSGVSHLTKSLITFGVLTQQQKGPIMSAAARTK